MLHPAVAAPIAFAAIALAAFGNRKVVGFLPDDPPRPGRKQHERPIPLAGVVLVPVVLPWLVAADAWLAVSVAVAGATGFVDDRHKERGVDFDWRWKALGLAVAAAAGAAGVTNLVADPLRFVAMAAFVFILTNATNFLDNTNGVGASLGATSLLVLSNGHGPVAAVGFAALGFLPWNWPRARLFLGDAGAYALGAATGVAAARAALTDASHLWAVAIQLADFAQVVIARLVLGLPPWVGDRRHLTHVVQNLGLPGIAVAPLFALIALAVAWRSGA